MTPHSVLRQSLTLIFHSSELPEISEARQFTTVALSRSLQTHNPHYHYGVHTLHCGPQHWWSRVSGVRLPGNKWIKNYSGTRWNRNFRQGSNVTCFSVVKFKTFSSINTQLQTDQFAEIVSMSTVQTLYRVIFELAYTNMSYRDNCAGSKNNLSIYIQTTSESVR